MREFAEKLRRWFMANSRLYVGRTHDPRGDKIKPDGTPVGNLDLYARDKLSRIIGDEFPNSLIIAEEDERSSAEMTEVLADQNSCQWTVDGLDGTGNRRMELQSFGAMVAERRAGIIIFAAIFRPADELLRGGGFFYAEAGGGAWRWCGECGEYHPLIAPQRAKELERTVVMLEGSSKKFFVPPISNLGAAITTRPSQSTSIAATTVAMGGASALVTVDNKPWDNWPAMLLIKEAGGVVTDWHGNPITPGNCGNMIAVARAEDLGTILKYTSPPNTPEQCALQAMAYIVS